MKRHSNLSRHSPIFWFFSFFIALFEVSLRHPGQAIWGLFFLNATVRAFDTPSAEEDGLVLRRPLTDQVAKSSESYDVAISPENYLVSSNLYHRFQIQAAANSSIPAWLTLTPSAEVEKILALDIEDQFKNGDLEGDLFFAASGKAGVKIYNVSDWRHPVLLSTIDTPGEAHGLDVQLPYMYLADGAEGFQIWDLSQGLFPKSYTSQVKGIWHALDVKVQNNTAYIAAETSFIRIVDLSNIAAPRELPPYTGVATIVGLTSYQDYLLGAGGVNGLFIFNFKSYPTPSLEITHQHQHPKWGKIGWVGIDGQYIHLRDGETKSNVRFKSELLFADNPTYGSINEALSPLLYFIHENTVVYAEGRHFKIRVRANQRWGIAELSHVDVSSSEDALAIQDNLLYVASRTFLGVDLSIVNITYPESPTMLGNYSSLNLVETIEVKGDIVYLGTVRGLEIINVSNPFLPTLLNKTGIGDHRSFALENHLAYIPTDTNLQIINISSPSMPTNVWAYPKRVAAIDVFNSVGYLALNKENRFQVVDFQNPASPQEVASLSMNGAYLVKVAGSFAYIITYSEPIGLAVIDIENKAAPKQVGFLSYGYMSSLDIVDSVVYLADHQTGVILLDVREPAELKEVGWLGRPNGELIRDVKKTGDILSYASSGSDVRVTWVNNWQAGIEYPSVGENARDLAFLNKLLLTIKPEGLQVFDVSNPYYPTLIGQWQQDLKNSYGLEVGDGQAYILDFGETGFWVVNISSPMNPSPLYYVDTSTKLYSLKVKDELVYLRNASSLLVGSFTESGNFTQITSKELEGDTFTIMQLKDDWVYTSTRGACLSIFQLVGSNQLKKIGSFEVLSASESIQVERTIVYVNCGGATSLRALDISDPSQPVEIFEYKKIESLFLYFGPFVVKKERLFIYLDRDSDVFLHVVDLANLYNLKVLALFPEINNSPFLLKMIDEDLYYRTYIDQSLRHFDMSHWLSPPPLTVAACSISYFDNHYWVLLSDTTVGVLDANSLKQVDSYTNGESLIRITQDELHNELWMQGRYDVRNVQTSEWLPKSRPLTESLVFNRNLMVAQAYHKKIGLFERVGSDWQRRYEVETKEFYFNELTFQGDLLATSLYQQSGVEIRNFSVTNNGTLLSFIQSIEPLSALHLDSGTLYLADPALGVITYDVSLAKQPQQLGVLRYESAPITKLLSTKKLLFASAGDKLLIIDAISPEAPVLLKQYELDAQIDDFIVHDNRIALALGEKGVQVLRPKNNAPQWQNQIRLSGSRPALDKTIYQLELVGIDSEGNLKLATPAFNVNYQHPPVVRNAVRDYAVNIFENVDIHLSPELIFDDADGDPLTLSIDNLPLWLQLDATRGQLTGQPIRGTQGKYALTLTASDSQGGEAKTNFVLTVLNRSPSFTQSIPEQQLYLGQWGSFTISNSTVEDSDQDELQWLAYLPAKLSWLTFDAESRTFSGTPKALINSPETITLTVSDGRASVSSELLLTVVGSLELIQLSEQVALNYIEDQPFALPVFAVDTPANNASVSFSLSDRLAGSIAAHGATLFSPLAGKFELLLQPLSQLNWQLSNLSFIPSRDYNRDISLRLVVNDGGLNLPKTKEEFIGGVNVNDPPELFNPISELQATENQAFSYIIPRDTFTDVDGDPLLYEVSGLNGAPLPKGFSFNPSTLTLTGTPTESGTMSFEVKASDHDYVTPAHPFRIKVAAAESLINRENLIALLPVGLTMTLVLTALGCYQRGRFRLKQLQVLLANINLEPAFRAVARQGSAQPILSRLYVLAEQASLNKDWERLNGLLAQFHQNALLLASRDTAFTLVSHPAYLHLLKLYLLPSIRRDVTAIAKKVSDKSCYPSDLLKRTQHAVSLFELALLVDSKFGQPINEMERFDMLIMLHYTMRNLKPKVQGYAVLRLQLLMALSALSSVRDTDTMIKFVIRAFGRLVPTLIGLARFNARKQYAEVLTIKYQLAYQITDTHSPALNNFINGQKRALKSPLLISAWIDAAKIICARTTDQQLKSLLIEGPKDRRFLGLKPLLKHRDSVVRNYSAYVLKSMEQTEQSEFTEESSLNTAPEKLEPGEWQTNPLVECKIHRSVPTTAGARFFSTKASLKGQDANPLQITNAIEEKAQEEQQYYQNAV